MTKFTMGEWKYDGITEDDRSHAWLVKLPVGGEISVEGRTDEEADANARLIAAAFNAATKLEALGYDGQAAIEGMVEAYKALKGLIAGIDQWNEEVKKITGRYADYSWITLEEGRAILTKARGVVGDEPREAG